MSRSLPITSLVLLALTLSACGEDPHPAPVAAPAPEAAPAPAPAPEAAPADAAVTAAVAVDGAVTNAAGAAAVADVWACTMHPEEQGVEGGDCSKCGMKLVKVDADVDAGHAPAAADTDGADDHAE